MTTITPSMVPAAPHGRLRLTRRGRAVLTALAALPFVLLAWFGALDGGGAFASLEPSDVQFEYLTVQPGQTLWQLAEELEPTADPRDVVADLMQLNRLESAELIAGEQLAIPVQYAD